MLALPRTQETEAEETCSHQPPRLRGHSELSQVRSWTPASPAGTSSVWGTISILNKVCTNSIEDHFTEALASESEGGTREQLQSLSSRPPPWAPPPIPCMEGSWGTQELFLQDCEGGGRKT